MVEITLESWAPGSGRCNTATGSLLEETRIELGLPEPERIWVFASLFDGTPTWNCAVPAAFRSVIGLSPYAVEVCATHQEVLRHLAEQNRALLHHSTPLSPS